MSSRSRRRPDRPAQSCRLCCLTPLSALPDSPDGAHPEDAASLCCLLTGLNDLHDSPRQQGSHDPCCANAAPPPEVELLLRKLTGAVWAKGDRRKWEKPALNKEVSTDPPSWNCVVPTAKASSARGVAGAHGGIRCSPATLITRVNMKRLCQNPQLYMPCHDCSWLGASVQAAGRDRPMCLFL